MSSSRLIMEGSGIVYHYTSLDTFFKILDGIKYEHFIFHGTDIFSMNDPTEFIHGFRQLWKILPQIEKDLYEKIRNNPQIYSVDKTFLDKRYRLSNMWDSKKGSNKSWLKAYVDEMHQSYKTPFVISFSCHEDYLPMWSTYGDKGNGIALGIDIQSYFRKTIMDDGTTLYDLTSFGSDDLFSLLVSYDPITKNHPISKYAGICIENYLKTIQSQNIDDETLLSLQFRALVNLTRYASALIKNEAYKYEKESRLVCFCNDTKGVQFKISSTKKVLPYIHVDIPVSKLKKVVIGPCCDFKAVKTALKTRFMQLGIILNDDDIVNSKVPYRHL